MEMGRHGQVIFLVYVGNYIFKDTIKCILKNGLSLKRHLFLRVTIS